MPCRSRAGTSGSDSSARTAVRCGVDSAPCDSRSHLPPGKSASRPTLLLAISRQDLVQGFRLWAQSLIAQLVQRLVRSGILRVELGLAAGDVKQSGQVFVVLGALLDGLQCDTAIGRVVGLIDFPQHD